MAQSQPVLPAHPLPFFLSTPSRQQKERKVAVQHDGINEGRQEVGESDILVSDVQKLLPKIIESTHPHLALFLAIKIVKLPISIHLSYSTPVTTA